ncbi:LysR family transcriptional regulator [Microbulbifer sp. VTAC004]|uniref:LysR family transcriptional regulator n=1 Tax=Microbulbifer sp. VTAC004 TaxID=3243386 RepID=UPI00403A408B
MLLANLSLFLQIVEKGSLVSAARDSGLSSSTVSERLAALEAHFGVVLLNRTTRAISLTDEGRTLVEGAKLVLGEVEDLESRIRLGAQTLSGTIRISAPCDLGRAIVAPEIDRFLQDHPAVSIELLLSDGYVDTVGQGIDVALRFGSITDSSLRVRTLGSKQRIVCASPAYLEKYGSPKKPEDLTSHNCLVMRFGENLDNSWRFREEVKGQKSEVSRAVTVRGDRITNDGELARQWCLNGLGIILKSELDVGSDIRAGRLVRLLSEYTPSAIPLQMLFPPSRAQPRRVGEFADRLAQRFKSIEVANT